MSNNRSISEYSRQELYDLIWSAPASKLAADFGISDVAIAKRCKNRNVPRPTRGYWAKVAAGRNPRKTPLPPSPDDVFKQNARRRIGKILSLPGETETLLPLATELMNEITKGKAERYKRVHFREKMFPDVTVSKALAMRAAQAFHTMIANLEPLGIHFRKSRSYYEDGYFERRHDRLYLTIMEDLVHLDGSRENAPHYQSPRGNEKLSGYLTFSLTPSRYGSREVKQWSEGPKVSLERTLAQVVAAVRNHFVEAQERREQEAIQRAKEHAEWLQRHQEWERQEAIRLKEEKERKHAEALAAIPRARKAALLKAADNWRQSNRLMEFISECEARWKNESCEISAEQIQWLKWASDIAAAMTPFSVGYPDPSNDGTFDASSIPVGGPYPRTRELK